MHNAYANRSEHTRPKVGDRVEHYVDGDYGTVLSVFREENGYIALSVQWDSHGDVLDPMEHYIDELYKAA